jgi:hypothetical protein
MKGTLNSGTTFNLSSVFTLETLFNLRNIGKTMNFTSSVSKTITFGSVTFNPVEKIFMILLKYRHKGNKGFFVKLNYFVYSSVGTALLPCRTSDVVCKLLKISTNPIGITYLNNSSYMVISERSDCSPVKYYVVNLV